MAWRGGHFVWLALLAGCPGPIQAPPPSPRCTSVVRYADTDRDGFGAGMQTVCAETPPSGLTERGGDCDDSDPTTHPAGLEVCFGGDDDCDGVVDEGVGLVFVADDDGDGFGSMRPDATTARACTPPEGFVQFSDDCDDDDPAIHPMASELCDELDQDCNGRVDDDPSFACRVDELVSCRTACGSIGSAPCDECLGPAATCTPPTEVCNRLDDDCDGRIDDGVRNVLTIEHEGLAGATFVQSVAALEGWIVVAQLADGALAAQPVAADGTPGLVTVLVAGSHTSRRGATRFDLALNDTSLFVAWTGDGAIQLLETDAAAPVAATPRRITSSAWALGDSVSIALLEQYVALAYVDAGRTLRVLGRAYDGSRVVHEDFVSSTAAASRPEIVAIADDYAVIAYRNGSAGVAARAFWFNGTGAGYITDVSDAPHLSGTSGAAGSLSAVRLAGASVGILWSVGTESMFEIVEYQYSTDDFATRVPAAARSVPTLASDCADVLTTGRARFLLGLASDPAVVRVETLTSLGDPEGTDLLDDDAGSIGCRAMHADRTGNLILFSLIGPTHVVSYRWGC